MANTTLRPAATLAAERHDRNAREKKSAFDRGVERIAKEIEQANMGRKTSVWSTSLSADVVKALEAEGYSVKFHGAAGMGDMDSHEVSWG